MLIVAALGPELQKHTLPLVVSYAPTIYDGIYPEHLARFPEIGNWLLLLLTPSALFVASATTLAAFSSRTPQGFAVSAAAGFFVSYTINDLLIILTLEPSISLGGSVLANLYGSLIIGLLSYSILYIFLSFFEFNLGGPTLNRITAAGAVAGIGVLIWIFSYYALNAFYRPLPVQIELVTSLPARGDYVAAKENGQPMAKNSSPPFSFAPDGSRMAAVTLESIHKAGNIEWRSDPKSQHFLLEVRVSSGCYGEQPSGNSKTKPIAIFPSLTALAVEQGADVIVFDGKDFTSSTSKYGAGSYYITGSDSPGHIDIQTFVGPDHVESFVFNDELDIIATTLLIDSQTVRSSRTISFFVDGHKHSITINSPVSYQRHDSVFCRWLSPSTVARSEFLETRTARVSADEPLASVVFTLKPTSQSIRSPTDFRSTATIGGINGWVTRKGVDAESARHLGRLGLLSVSDNLSSLSVRGEQEQVGPEDSLFIVGELRVSHAAGQRLTALGRAGAVWKNGVRLNQTRWEQLNDTWKMGILGLLGGLFLALGRAVLPALGRRSTEDPITWMP